MKRLDELVLVGAANAAAVVEAQGGLKEENNTKGFSFNSFAKRKKIGILRHKQISVFNPLAHSSVSTTKKHFF